MSSRSTALRLAAAVSDLEHGGVSFNNVHGVGENDQGGEVLGDAAEGEVGEVLGDAVEEAEMEEEEEEEEEEGRRRRREREEEEEEEEAVKAKPASKRRRKTRGTKSEAKSSKVEEEDRQTGRGQTEGSETDESISDSSDISGFKINNSQQKKLYTVEMIQSFLAQTKNAKGVKIEEHFPVLSLFYTSARLHMSQKDESGLTDQEVFRLRKLVLKAKRQMNNDDGKISNVCFN